MPNRRSQNRNRRLRSRGHAGGGRGGQIERISGRAVFSLTSVAPNAVVGITVHPTFPSTFIFGTGSVVDFGVSKLQALSLLFRYYRFVKLAFRWRGASAMMTTGSSGSYGLVGTYLGGDSPNADAPMTPDQVMEQPFQFRSQTTQWSWSSNLVTTLFPTVPKSEAIPRSMLFGRQPVKWWLCETDMATAVAPGMMVYQGQLFFSPIPYWLEGVSTTFSWQFELDYTVEFTEFQAHPTGMFSGGLKKKLIQEKESDEKSDDEVELDDASLMIIANNSTGLGAQATKEYAESSMKKALDQAKWDEAIARAKVHRLETKLKESSPEKVIITPQ